MSGYDIDLQVHDPYMNHDPRKRMNLLRSDDDSFMIFDESILTDHD